MRTFAEYPSAAAAGRYADRGAAARPIRAAWDRAVITVRRFAVAICCGVAALRGIGGPLAPAAPSHDQEVNLGQVCGSPPTPHGGRTPAAAASLPTVERRRGDLLARVARPSHHDRQGLAGPHL